MRYFNRFFPVLLCAFVLFSGCKKATQDIQQKKTYNIGIVQYIDNGAFSDMRSGFLARMQELGFDDNTLSVNYKNAQGDIGTLNAICQEMANSKYDLVVTIATPATQTFVNLESGIPNIFIAVSDPVAAGIVTTMEKPDKLATGTSNMVPADQIFKLADVLTPEVHNFGILYNTGETNSVSTVRKAKAYLEANGYTYTETTVASSAEIQEAAQVLAGKAEAIYVPNDAMIQSAMPQVAQIAKNARIPVYGSSHVMVQSGALATVSIDDKQIGAISADMAALYFAGTSIEQIPAVTVDKFATLINKTTAETIGITIPVALQDAHFIE
jgi:putative ABC transport system substrate-binding protein